MTSRSEIKTVVLEVTSLLFAGEAIWAHYALLTDPTFTLGLFKTTPMAIIALCGNFSLTALGQILGNRESKALGRKTPLANKLPVALGWTLTVEDFVLAGSKNYNLDGVAFVILTALAFFILSEVNSAVDKRMKKKEENLLAEEDNWVHFDLELQLLTRKPI